MNKKMTLLAGAISSVLSGAALADINNIIISEYVEGSSNNKAIELLNTSDTDFIFDDSYGLYYGSHENMIQAADGTSVLEGVTVPANGTVVIVNPDASDALKNAVSANGAKAVVAGTYDEVRYSAMNFNGDDAVWIASASDSEKVHDIIGVNGSYWGSNKTLVRANNATIPDTVYQPYHWATENQDTFTGLGDATLAPPPPLPTPCKDANYTSKTIAEIQGSGAQSPLLEDGITYEVTGVVSAVSPSFAGGFYLTDITVDGDPLTSDGIFVDAEGADLIVTSAMVGTEVCVVSQATEKDGVTQLKPADGTWEVINDTPVAVQAVDLVRHADDASFEDTLERYEGMLVKTVEAMGFTQAEIEAQVALITVERLDSESDEDYQTRLEAAKQAKRDELESADGHDMRVSRTFSFDYDSFRNNLVMAYKRPNPQPNQLHVAGSQEALDQAAQNNDYRLYLESDAKPGNGEMPYYPEFGNDHYVRINDSVVGIEGVIHYSDDQYRMIVPSEKTYKSSQKVFVHNTPRNSGPDLETKFGDDGFTITVATQNVLNYFNSPYGGSDNQFGDNRGAESQLDFERQQAKIVEAIYDLQADIIGLMEIENNGFGDFSAINELVAAINAKYTEEDYSKKHYKSSIHNRYVFVGFDKNGDLVLDEDDTIGSDAITTGVIYRPSAVSIVSGEVITMPEQHAPMIVYPEGHSNAGAAVIDDKGEVRESGDNYQRNTIAATFQVHNTGKKLTVAINHLKSKGSTCYEDWNGWQEWDNFDPVEGDVRNDDFQGNCENFRVAAVTHLGEELSKIAQREGSDQVVLGDFNAYAHEDPMLVMTKNPTGKAIYAAGYTFIDGEVQYGASGQRITKTFGYINAVDEKAPEGEMPWSYSYNDEVGSLDHLLISQSLESRLVDATDWHINAPESPLFDYNSEYKGGDTNEPNPFYAESPYRSSDHDSALVTLGYKYNEGGEAPVSLAIKSGRADIAFPVSADARKGHVAEISISPRPNGIALPKVTLDDDGAQTVMFDVVGLETGNYTFTMTLKSDVAAADASSTDVIETKSFTADVVKRDSSNVSPVTTSYDGSGGSFGFGALLSLLGLGFLRRRKA